MRIDLRTLVFVFAVALTIALQPTAVDAGNSPWIGTVTLCQGDVTLQRGDKAFSVSRGAGIRSADIIATERDTLVTFTLNGGPAITLGPQASVSVSQVRGLWSVVALGGQMRIVHDGNAALRLLAGDASFWVERAIILLNNKQDQTSFELVAGAIEYESSSMEPVRFTQPGAFVARGSELQRVDALLWSLDARQIQLVAAMQTTPLLQPPTTIPGNAPPISESPDLPNGLPDSQFPVDDDEEEDELPQFAPDPSPAATTRAAVDDGMPVDSGVGATNNTFGGSSSLSLGSLSSASGTFFSGGIFGDANQQTIQGRVDGNVGPFTDGDPFPGGIHLVTGETRLPFADVQLSMTEFGTLFSGAADKFFSIGTGAAPTGQVVTNFFTGTGTTPNVIDVPGFDAHLIELDQYNIPDPAQGALDNNIGLTGLIGPVPTAPTVIGAAPLVDERANLNQGATFALGEFLVTATGSNGVTFTIRRSDQDRLIVKDPGGNDANDLVTPNGDVDFDDSVDPRFLPQSPTVKTPGSLSNVGTGIGELNFLRRAAFTTLVADQLQDYSGRTGQTRFVVDGKIIDISGYRP